MPERPLSQILADIDPASIIVDSFGRITGIDSETTSRLRELAVPDVDVNLTDSNGSMCKCGRE